MENDNLLHRERALSLFEQYQFMLTLSQQKIFSSYYQYDLSLSEVAEQEGISRAAVHDSLSKTIEKMEELEAKLHLVEKYEQLTSILVKYTDNNSIDNKLLEDIKQWLSNH